MGDHHVLHVLQVEAEAFLDLQVFGTAAVHPFAVAAASLTAAAAAWLNFVVAVAWLTAVVAIAVAVGGSSAEPAAETFAAHLDVGIPVD